MNAPNKATSVVAAPAGSLVRAKIDALRANLNLRFRERAAEITGLLVAALAGEHCLMLGPPGTGKSALARAFADALAGANYFEWLLTRFSTPEELYGPIKMSALKADRFARATTGKLPECHVAFLDEIFKANSAVLNSLLAAVNERVFHDDGGVQSIPLLTCVAASNEMPEGPELAALWDRFVLRYFVSYTKTEDSFTAMLAGGIPAITKSIGLDEWKSARDEVNAVTIPLEVIKSLFALRGTLEKQGVVVSDRRWVKAAQLLRANAWLNGSSVVGAFHFEILIACLWNTPEQETLVRAEVMKIAGAEVVAAQRIADAALDLLQRLPPESDKTFTDRASSAREELKKAKFKIAEVKKTAKDALVRKRIDEIEAQVQQAGVALVQQIKNSIGLDF